MIILKSVKRTFQGQVVAVGGEAKDGYITYTHFQLSPYLYEILVSIKNNMAQPRNLGSSDSRNT